MIFNNENVDLGKVEAFDDCIVIVSHDVKIKLILNFNREKDKFIDMEINEQIDLNKYLYWDTTLYINDGYYLFDIAKDKVCLTKLDENQYKIEVDIENPDMIYCSMVENKSFYNLKINTEFEISDNDKTNKKSLYEGM